MDRFRPASRAPARRGDEGFLRYRYHDRVVLDGLRAVPDGSVLLCLGDISVRKDAYALGRLAELKAEKNLTMWLIPGNHDRIHPMFGPESVAEWTPLYREIFDVIALDLQVRIGRWQVLMTHLPRASGKDAVPDPHQTPQLARGRGARASTAPCTGTRIPRCRCGASTWTSAWRRQVWLRSPRSGWRSW
ncbi:MAG TPA: hypothetical protein DCL06_04185 [Corynebacterium variabile]|uniref:Calcineurin-like phosphoesterase domain-containing protein n=1 Tax=Corynebacterium variabile TaxID=1727 RepID=A0A3B9QTA1_9CORY|nr:hypothetical protein [Corynebacterium variabile]